jgi:NAD(P)H-dependent FMN reductase
MVTATFEEKEETHAMDSPVRVAIIIGSTREGRFGPTVARWFAEQAAPRDDLSGQPLDAAGTGAAAKTMLDQLAWWAVALRNARAERPYAA